MWFDECGGSASATADKVEKYDGRVVRQVLAREFTGLWRVAGRSNLLRGEFVRPGSFIRRNWSIVHDHVILSRTVGALFAGEGAY
jgi:lipopolysaccharide/colanic/teichoic acid biosynthesis glycosyltransferase